MSNRLGNNGGRSYDFLFQPVKIDCSFIVDSANGNGLGIRSLKGSGVRNVFMHTSSTPGSNDGYLNPNPASGYALIQLKENYFKYAGGFSGFVSPVSGSNVAINGSALTVGQPYIITSVGAGSAGVQTIVCTADTAGSLASKYFVIYDAYGNSFVVWFQVAGVGGPPVGVYGTPVPVSIASGAANTAVASALNTVLGALTANTLLNPGAPAVSSFTTGVVSATVTVTNVVNQPFVGGAQDGAGTLNTAFTFAVTKDQTNIQNWQAVGLPKGVVPNLGAAFVATATGYSSRGGSTGLVKVPGVSGITSVEVVGDVNQSLNPIPMGGSAHKGGWVLVQLLGATNSSTTTLIPTAPADGSVMGMSFLCESKSIIVAGE